MNICYEEVVRNLQSTVTQQEAKYIMKQWPFTLNKSTKQWKFCEYILIIEFEYRPYQTGILYLS